MGILKAWKQFVFWHKIGAHLANKAMDINFDLKIFLVDDDLLYVNKYKKHISNLNYKNITCFESCDECLESLSLQPDIIFLNHDMGGINGLEVLKKIKRFHQDISVVLLSGTASLKTAVNALKFGAHDYIVKGLFELENMEKVLTNVSRSKELNK